MKKISSMVVAAGFFFSLLVGQVFGLPLEDLYPTVVADPADVKLSFDEGNTFNNANTAYGYFAGNDTNGVGDLTTLIGGIAFQLLAKSDNAASGSALSGFDFDVTADQNSSGDFMLSWTGGVPPAWFDFVFTVKSSKGYAYYLFDDVGIYTTPGEMEGTFIVKIKNKPGTAFQDLSHMSVYGRTGDIPDVPEAATMILFGTGLLGLAGIGRRRNRK